MRPILLLDNRDSFVWNLAQAFQILGERIEVVRSDAITADAIGADPPRALVVSPGPGHPTRAGNTVSIIRALSGGVASLGVCLGHQAIAVAFGGKLYRAAPCHGKPWAIDHESTGLFTGLPSPLQACRYHSLAVHAETLPDDLAVDARNPEGLIMSLRHRSHPTYGLQFHPESFRTPRGLDLLRNFLAVCS